MAAKKPVFTEDKATIPELVRRLADKDYEAARAAGRIAYQGGPGPGGFRPQEVQCRQ